ncbi:activator-dependent family glycosyltransferase [Actinokineospora sp.]|uniref:activator-dependent family glycosyltransferase n=1 Tax=Actinokineospora sp. TaxID=1872133 RepID=UPI004037B742
MRILFAVYPERTHFLSMAPMAWALRTAGHEVRVASQPDFAATITQAGLTAVPVGGRSEVRQLITRVPNWIDDAATGGMPRLYDAADRRPEDITWAYLRDGYQAQVERWHKVTNFPITADLVRFAQHWRPDLVIWEPLTYAGAIAATACGAAHARLVFGVDMYGVTRDHFLRLKAEQPAEAHDDAMAAWLGGYARKHGADFTEDMITGQFSIDLVPPSLQKRADRRYVPMRYVPYGGPAVIPKWLQVPPERPRVALTLGLSSSDYDRQYAASVQDILDSVADLDIELVATISAAEQAKLARVPDNARLVPFVPLHALAQTCTVVIHHGGFGTLATTALHAVPQLILPWDNDGPALARGVAEVGAGLTMHPARATGQAIRENVVRLIDDRAFTAGAALLRDELLAMPTPNEVAADIERLVAESGHRSSQPTLLSRS